MSTTLRRGPRGGGEDTQAQILDAARALFAARVDEVHVRAAAGSSSRTTL